MTLYRKFIISAACATIVSFGAFYAAFLYQFDAPIPSGYDAANWNTYKNLVGINTPGKRILLFGDSSTVFGVNSELLSKKTGMPVANMALHGGLPLDALTKSVIKNSREGDTVVMSLVWLYYFKDYRTPEDWILREMVAWYGDYFYSLPFLTKLKYMSAIDMKTLYTNMDVKSKKDAVLKEFPYRRALTMDEIRVQYAKIDRTAPQPFSYSYLNMNSSEDIQGACGTHPIANMVSIDIPQNPKVNKNVLELLSDTAKELKSKGVAFYIAPSVTVQDERSNKESYHKALMTMMEQIRAAGVPIVGNPDDFYFPLSSFYDTAFHINCENTVERTSRLYTIIKDYLPKTTLTASPRATN